MKLDSILEVPPEREGAGSANEAELVAQSILDSIIISLDEQQGKSSSSPADGRARGGQQQILTPRFKAPVLSPGSIRKREIPEELVSKDAVLRSDLPDAFTPRGAAGKIGVAGPRASLPSPRAEGRAENARAGQVASPAAIWNTALALRLVLVFDKVACMC